MRPVLFGFFLAVGALYSVGAIYFHAQERWAQYVSEARTVPVSRLHHPEATLALIRERMERNDFSPRVKPLVHRALRQVPSFYQPPVFLAAYHANRFEAAEETYRAFEGAIRRYPANGRLHLDFARWLFMAHSSLPGVPDPDSPGRVRNLFEEGEDHLKIALSLEPDLTRQGLETFRRYNVPADRWAELVPEDESARRQLIVALAQEGQHEEALVLLRSLLKEITDVRYCRQAASWALAWGDPALALEAVERWKAIAVPQDRQRGIEPHVAGLLTARAYLALGETDAAYEVFRDTLNDVGPSTSSGVELLVAMGYEYLSLGRVALAQSVFTEATGYSPTNVRALLGLARAYRRAGKNREAVEEYRKVLRLDPTNKTALREMDRLIAQRSRY